MNLVLADRSDKKCVKRFYKANNYSANFMGNDHCYLIKVENKIIATVIISNIDDINFLHGLVVTKEYQHKGLASQLLAHSSSKHSMIYCFADLSLNSLYTANSYEQIDTSQLSEALLTRFNNYQNKNSQLTAFRSSK